MSTTATQSPLGVNVLGSLLANTGLTINSVATGYMGSSTSLAQYTLGSICNNTVLKSLTYAIRAGYVNNIATNLSNEVYNNLISIGSTSIPALGNARAPTFTWDQEPGSYGMGFTSAPKGWGGAQYTAGNEATSWGYIRLFAYQAYNEFNYNSTLPNYADFLSSFGTASGFIDYTNPTITSVDNAAKFMQGTYSNMNDMITGDVTGVSLATIQFGQDLINLGKALDLTYINSFGLPSNLLDTLKLNNGITKAVSLAILSSGITVSEFSSLLNNTAQPTIDQERKLYGAFSVIVANDLMSVLIPLNCNTQGLESLVDLLNIKKMFPSSYQTLTVPVYNASSQVTNSKTYYPIYENSGINMRLTSPAVTSQFANTTSFIPTSTENNATGTINVQTLKQGLGAYVFGILPTDVAIAAGAFAASMGQIKNIVNVPIEKFAQLVTNLETTKGLNINGTDIPTNAALQAQGKALLALGSGPQGTYTMGDFFGSMSGTPYNKLFGIIEEQLLALGTDTLSNIYSDLWWAASWANAEGTVLYDVDKVALTYQITGVVLTNPGGSYGRNGAPVPSVSITGPSGATATCKIGTNPDNIGTIYGKVYDLQLINPGDPVPYIPTDPINHPEIVPVADRPALIIDPPPGIGWPNLNATVQNLIDQANAEISRIFATSLERSTALNDAWNATGTQLTIEQRARQKGLQPPLPTPRDPDIVATTPVTQTNFVDSISGYALNTKPNMYAQTLESIANLDTQGGQSIVALMREFRNQVRLAEAGIPIDNTIPSTLNRKETSILIANSPSNFSPYGYYNPVNESYIVNGSAVPVGKPIVLGSLAGSQYTNIVPPELNTLYTSNTLLPSTYSPQEALDEVVRCNCDCWTLV
jgi:hypothetical protein